MPSYPRWQNDRVLRSYLCISTIGSTSLIDIYKGFMLMRKIAYITNRNCPTHAWDFYTQLKFPSQKISHPWFFVTFPTRYVIDIPYFFCLIQCTYRLVRDCRKKLNLLLISLKLYCIVLYYTVLYFIGQ